MNKNDLSNQKGYLEKIWRIQKVGDYYIFFKKKNDLDEHQEVLELHTKVFLKLNILKYHFKKILQN